MKTLIILKLFATIKALLNLDTPSFSLPFFPYFAQKYVREINHGFAYNSKNAYEVCLQTVGVFKKFLNQLIDIQWTKQSL